MLGIHHLELLDIGETKVCNPPPRLTEHRFGQIYPNYAMLAGVVGERDAGAHAHFENPPSDPVGRGDRCLTPAGEHAPEDQILDRRPARIGLLQRDQVEFCREFFANCLCHQTCHCHVSGFTTT
jgi:hypothetical protein